MANVAVYWLNAAMGAIFGALVWPFRALDPVLALLAVSLVSGVLALWVFGKVSNQAAIRTVRDRIRGNVIGVRLFGDELPILFKLQGKILWDTAIYMRYALFPTLVLMVPFLLILAQSNLWFSVRPLRPGETTVVKVRLAEGIDPATAVSLDVPEGVVVETGGVRAPELRESAWRIRATEPGRYELKIRAGSESVTKSLAVGGEWDAVSPLRTGEGAIPLLLYPGEKPIPTASPVSAVEVAYPELPLTVFGFGLHWLVILFAGVIVFAFAFRGLLGVEF